MRTHLDLFSGIGGFALAAGWAGFKTIGFSEIDAYASAVLRKHWPGVPNYGDVRTVPAIRCDLITGGFPCQPFSCAGKRRGKEDHRFIWPAMCDVIGRCKPAWVLGENVPGIIGMELDRVQSDLESLGFRTATLVIPACAVDARHRRDRVWVVANTVRRFGSLGRNLGRNRWNLQSTEEPCHWKTTHQPATLGVAHGIPSRVDRLKCLGNSIIPQVAYQILKNIAILEGQA